jgi:hypothetical protein
VVRLLHTTCHEMAALAGNGEAGSRGWRDHRVRVGCKAAEVAAKEIYAVMVGVRVVGGKR